MRGKGFIQNRINPYAHPPNFVGFFGLRVRIATSLSLLAMTRDTKIMRSKSSLGEGGCPKGRRMRDCNKSGRTQFAPTV